jgi:transposase
VVAHDRGSQRAGTTGGAGDGQGDAGGAPARAALGQPVGPQQQWAIEDCRHLSRRLERDLLAAGEQVVRVPPKLAAGVRRSARTPGKSDPIDALAVARAALREPELPVACLDGAER